MDITIFTKQGYSIKAHDRSEGIQALAAQVTHRLAFGDFVIAAQIDDPRSIRRGVYVSISSNDREPIATIIPIDGESDCFRSSLSMAGWLRDDHLTSDELEFAEHVRAILRARR